MSAAGTAPASPPATDPNDLLLRLLGPLRRHSRWRARRLSLDPDDVLGEAAVLVLAHAAEYDPARGDGPNWIWYFVRTAAARVRQQRGRDRARGGVAFDELFASAAADEGIGLDAGAARAAVAGLPDRERQVVERRFGLDGRGGASDMEVAAELGVARQAVNWHLNRALARLREAMVDTSSPRSVVREVSPSRTAALSAPSLSERLRSGWLMVGSGLPVGPRHAPRSG